VWSTVGLPRFGGQVSSAGKICLFWAYPDSVDR
jgi:hypothetical protein